MFCYNKKCSWNIINKCGFPYEISIAEDGRCNEADERNDSNEEGE